MLSWLAIGLTLALCTSMSRRISLLEKQIDELCGGVVDDEDWPSVNEDDGGDSL